MALARRVRLGLSLPAARALLAVMDRDGNGYISVDEFLQTVDLLKSGVARVGASGAGAAAAAEAGAGAGTGTVGVRRRRTWSEAVAEEEEEEEAAAAEAKLTKLSLARGLLRLTHSRCFTRWSRLAAAAQTAVLCLRHRGESHQMAAAVDRADAALVVVLAVEAWAYTLPLLSST